MSASKSSSSTKVTSDKAAAAKNLALFSTSTFTMSSVARQFLRGFEDNIESKNVASASKPTNNPPESTVVVEATSTVADDEVQVLGVKCSRIFNWRTPNAKQCTNWAVKGGRARKAQYCPTCAKELKERDNERKRKERQAGYIPRRKIKREKKEELTGEEEKNEEIEVIPQEENQKVEKLEMTPQKS